MVFSWTATGKVQYEFHGEPDVEPAGAVADYFESYQKDDKVGIEQSNGTFTAPSTGIEGWFWDNESPQPVTVPTWTPAMSTKSPGCSPDASVNSAEYPVRDCELRFSRLAVTMMVATTATATNRASLASVPHGKG